MKNRRLLWGLLFIALLALFLWYQSIPAVPEGQPALVTIDTSSVAELRTEFNRNVDRVRMIVLLSPT